MKFTIDKQESYTIFSIEEGKLNSLVAPDLKSELVFLNTEGAKNIILDMSKIEFVDSSGLSAILVANRLCQRDGGSFILSNLSENVLRLIQISQLDKVLKILPTVQEAKDYVMMEELERELNNSNDNDNGEL